MVKITTIIILFLALPCIVFCESFKERVDKRESKFIWQQVQDDEVIVSKYYTLVTMIINFKTIEKVQKGEIKNQKLTNILATFDTIVKKEGRTKKAFIKMYNHLNKLIPDGELTKGSASILHVLELGGDCNDVSPLFYSLFKYYGFNIWTVIGKSLNIQDDTIAYHIWLAVIFDDDKIIELDSLWYQPYYELNRTHGNIPLTGVRDEYIIRRKLSPN